MCIRMTFQSINRFHLKKGIKPNRLELNLFYQRALFCFVVDLFIISATYPTNIYTITLYLLNSAFLTKTACCRSMHGTTLILLTSYIYVNENVKNVCKFPHIGLFINENTFRS